MYLKVQKSITLNGKVIPPGSKSQSIRGIILALLAEGESTLVNVLDSDDTGHALQVCKQLGVNVLQDEKKLYLKSNGVPIETHVKSINTGNSGITTRFIMPLLGLRKNSQESIIVNCGEQMRARPIKSLVTALTDLGLTIKYLEQDGILPVAVSGNLTGGSAEVEGMTSQYISALLLSLPCAEQDSQITVRNLHERPYMEMTLNWLDKQHIEYTHEHVGNTDVFQIKGKQKYKKFNATIAADFSSSSYIIAAAVLMGDLVEISGIDMQDPQGDKRLITILQKMGADICIEATHLLIRGKKPLKGIKIDANDIPDLLPTLAVIATQAIGKTEICNVQQARIKETDRIHSMTEGLRLLGASVDEHKDGLTVYQSMLSGACVKGYDDHRTVMALSLAGMLAEGLTIIDDAEAINKTFPSYVETMRSIGAVMEVSDEN